MKRGHPAWEAQPAPSPWAGALWSPARRFKLLRVTVASGEEGGRRSSFGADLRAVLAERDFRKLFASRLVSQTGDGVFNAGFAAYAFFSAQSFPNPAAAVDAFAVLYLPYSLIGPFAGVFIDRWSRRQIIVYGALIRAAMVAVAGFVVLSGQTGIPLYISALAVLGGEPVLPVRRLGRAPRTSSAATSW